MVKVIRDLVIEECSLVDEPANPEAVIEIVKRRGGPVVPESPLVRLAKERTAARAGLRPAFASAVGESPIVKHAKALAEAAKGPEQRAADVLALAKVRDDDSPIVKAAKLARARAEAAARLA